MRHPVNPEIIKAQTEGCIVMGLTSTYKSGLTIDKGKVVEQNFNTYKMLRIEESPAVAPALTNAIFELKKTHSVTSF